VRYEIIGVLPKLLKVVPDLDKDRLAFDVDPRNAVYIGKYEAITGWTY
jgi:hypothetical protein